MLLQLLGLGIGLSAIDVDNAGSLRGVGVGTTVWSLVSPLVAMFCGGLLAGRLAQTYDRKNAGAHGLVMWAMTSILGLCATIWVVTGIVAGAVQGAAAIDATGRMISPTSSDARALTLGELGLDGADVLAPINRQLSAQGKPTISVSQLEAAVRGMVSSGLAQGNFDQELLVDQLVANTQLSRADAADVERQLEARVDASHPGTHAIEHRAERYVLGKADATGKALTTVGLSLLLSLITSVLGAMVALRRSRDPEEGGSSRSVRTTDPGFSPPNEPVIPKTMYPPQ
jgi:hypothetical protein